jgi:integrase
LLRQHESDQALEREHAAQLWHEGGWLFATPTGEPVNPRTDYTEWKRVLIAAGVRKGRLHDARHTAATVLLVLGVPDRVVMDIMGWSNAAMAKRYQHLTTNVREDVASRLDGLIWEAADGDDHGDEDSGGSADVSGLRRK